MKTLSSIILVEENGEWTYDDEGPDRRIKGVKPAAQYVGKNPNDYGPYDTGPGGSRSCFRVGDHVEGEQLESATT